MGGIDVTLDRLSSRVLDKSSLTIDSIATKGEASVRPSCNHAGIPASGDPKPMAKPHESGGMEWLIAGAVLKRLLLVVYVAAVFIQSPLRPCMPSSTRQRQRQRQR